ncbi:hypothetical protein [Marinobacter sp. C2H3]|uniref:hypothetical protein n=1 Tax=Marinobacter sp. C2H3 TaxID=3119003 RepID=UPI00300EA72A
MSLLSTLLRASTQFQNGLDGGRTPASPAEPASAKASNGAADSASNGSATDDRFTRSATTEAPNDLKTRRLPLNHYKQSIGQDVAFVRETLRHKLAEYNQSPATALNVSRRPNGGLGLDGALPDTIRQQIEKDLNHNRGFKDAFSRLSAAEPTLKFMDNALKLNQAYGVNNSVLDSVVSENQQFNGLQDVLHRYDSLRKSASATRLEAGGESALYAFRLNARA